MCFDQLLIVSDFWVKGREEVKSEVFYSSDFVLSEGFAFFHLVDFFGCSSFFFLDN